MALNLVKYRNKAQIIIDTVDDKYILYPLNEWIKYSSVHSWRASLANISSCTECAINLNDDSPLKELAQKMVSDYNNAKENERNKKERNKEFRKQLRPGCQFNKDETYVGKVNGKHLMAYRYSNSSYVSFRYLASLTSLDIDRIESTDLSKDELCNSITRRDYTVSNATTRLTDVQFSELIRTIEW